MIYIFKNGLYQGTVNSHSEVNEFVSGLPYTGTAQVGELYQLYRLGWFGRFVEAGSVSRIQWS